MQGAKTAGSLKGTRGVSGEQKAGDSNMASSQAAALTNVLHRVKVVEECQSRSTLMFNKLRLDVENAVSRICELEFSHKSTLREMNRLLQRFGEQMAISRRNEQEKARLTFLHLREEMEEERNTCRLLQMQNKKLTEDLTHANIAAADACEELSRERKAREMLEEVCNELAREIGEDKAEVEQLKQEQEESRERLERELRLMRMSTSCREEKVRSKFVEEKLELECDGKQSVPLHELQKLEALDKVTAIGTYSGSQEDTFDRADGTKLLTQAMEKMEHGKFRKIEDNMNGSCSTAHLASVPAWLDAHFSEERASSNVDSQLLKDGGSHLALETETVNNIEHRVFARKHRMPRRRLRTNSQQGQNKGVIGPDVRVCDTKNPEFWESYCRNSAWPSSEDEPDKRHLVAAQNPHVMGGLVLKGDSKNTCNLHGIANLRVGDNIEITHGTQERESSSFSSLGKHAIPKTGLSHQESLSNDAIGTGSPKKYSLSARFEAGKLGCKSEVDMGPSIQHSFSEDDAPSYIASRTERGRKQGGSSNYLSMKGEEGQAGCSTARNDHCGNNLLKSTNGGEVRIGDDSELDDFYFEPVRGPAHMVHNELTNRASEDEVGISEARPERGFVKCGGDACCGVMAKCSQVCKDLKADEKSGCSSVFANQGAGGSMISGGQETANKMSPWRSTSGKPLQCLWPPSPDAFSRYGGSKRRGKTGSSTSVDVENEGGLPLHARRHTSPAKQAVHQQPVGQKAELLGVRSNSLGAELIKARTCDTDKPPKTSFRFSPLRRATSHG